MLFCIFLPRNNFFPHFSIVSCAEESGDWWNYSCAKRTWILKRGHPIGTPVALGVPGVPSVYVRVKYFSYPVQSFGALSAISATFSSLFREVRFRKAPRGAIDVIQFKHFYKTHYKELGKKLWNLHFLIFKGFTHAHAIIFQTKSITIILHFNCTNKCVNMRKSK